MNIPTLLTLIRILCVPVLVMLQVIDFTSHQLLLSFLFLKQLLLH